MIRLLVPVCLPMFILGGLVSGILGLSSLASLAPAPPNPKLNTPTQTPVRKSLPTSAPAAAAAVIVNRSIAVPTPTTQPANGSAWLYVVDGNLWETNAGTPLQLTNGGGISQAALGAAGLVFVERSRNGSDLWLASSDGPPHAITRNAASSPSQSHWASEPVFLPDRERLYASADINKASTGAGDLAIWEFGFEQEAPIQITQPPAYAGGDQDVTVNPEDGRQIIFTRYDYAGTQLVEQLQWLDVGTDTRVPLTQTDQSARQASYAPDAKEVAFVQHDSGGQEDLYVADVHISDGRAYLEGPRQAATGMIANPQWTSDGNALGYLALTAGGFQLFYVDVHRDAVGTETFGMPHQITNGPGLDATSHAVFLSGTQADEIRQWLASLAT